MVNDRVVKNSVQLQKNIVQKVKKYVKKQNIKIKFVIETNCTVLQQTLYKLHEWDTYNYHEL